MNANYQDFLRIKEITGIQFTRDLYNALDALDQAHGAPRDGYARVDGLMADWDVCQAVMKDPKFKAYFESLPNQQFFWERLIRLGVGRGLKDESYSTPSSGWFQQFSGAAVVSTPLAGTWQVVGRGLSTKGCPVTFRRIP
jgi:hypothetical protein